MNRPDYETDKFEDIVSKDSRYDAKAYAFLMEVLHNISIDESENEEKHFVAEDVMNEFREFAIDLFGPLVYTVMTEWGVTRCEDIGEMMFNLVDAHRIRKDPNDTPEAFVGGFDFKDAFLLPYE